MSPPTLLQSPPFSLVVPPLAPDALFVHRWKGREALSEPYLFDLWVSADQPGLLEPLLGRGATLVVRAGAAPRTIHGVIVSLRAGDARERGRSTYRVRIAPRLELLSHERASRIFQDRTVPDVVREVLAARGIPSEWRLSRAYPVRPFITQYRESTRAFVERLLAEAGIFYAFDTLPSLDRETMIFGDSASAWGVCAQPVLDVVHQQGLSTDGAAQVASFTRRHDVRTRRARFADYDPDRPLLPLDARVELSAEGVIGEALQVGLLEAAVGVAGVAVGAAAMTDPAAAGIAGAALHGVDGSGALEEDAHGGHFQFPLWEDVRAESRALLAARRRRADVATGASRSSAITPGVRFLLEGHPLAHLDGDYAIVAVRHRAAVGDADDHYGNTFECVPATAHYPPARPAPRCVQAAHTATVVGPAGEEIHTDASGRIKVRFHWDRRGGGDTSCWIRPMQAWAGGGWGSQFIPRVGMEVVVAFDGGDPDRPIVLGCVANGTHPMPFPLPEDKTRSGIRTQTYKGSGHNELSFEDAPERQQIYVHAQRDLDEVVQRAHTLHVHGDETIRVDGSRVDHVERTDRLTVAGVRSEIVEGDVSVEHRASRVDAITKNLDLRVSGVRTTRVGVRDDLEVQGIAEHRYAADATTRVLGNATLIVGQTDAARSLAVHVEGGANVSASRAIELSATEGIVLRCGKTTLRIDENGIELTGGTIRAAGEKGAIDVGGQGVKLRSGDGYAHFDDKILVKTADASISMGKEVKLDGQRVLLNAPDKAKDAPAPPPEPPTEIVLVDKAGDPLPGCRFLVVLDDGSERGGVTDKDGKARIDLPSGGKIRFPDLSEVSA